MKTLVFHLVGVLTLGIGYLLAYWYSLDYMIYDSEDHDNAEVLLIVTFEDEYLLLPFQEKEFQLDPFDCSCRRRVRYVLFNHRKYFYSPQKTHFSAVETKFGDQFQMAKTLTLEERCLRGLDQKDSFELTKTFGENQLVFETPGILKLVLVGLMSPITFCLWFLAIICLFANKYIQGVIYLAYSVIIVVFYISETRRKGEKIHTMNKVEGTYPVLRRHDEGDNNMEELNVNNISYRETNINKTRPQVESNDVIEEMASDLEDVSQVEDSNFKKIKNSNENFSRMYKSKSTPNYFSSISRILNKNLSFTSNQFEDVAITQLLPGDLVLVQPKQSIPCDMLLVQGSCLVNEALLTGESVSITKSRISNGETLTSVHVLYAGSDCLMLRDAKVVGLVLNTGWNTFKGKIIASLIFNKTVETKFVQQVFVVCKWLVVIFGVFNIFMIVNDFYKGQFDLLKTLRYTSDLMANGCQPTTLFMLSISTIIIAGRLEKKGVTVMHSKKLFHAGRVQTVCFDKTGTLTQNGLCVVGVTLGMDRTFTKIYKDVKEMKNIDTVKIQEELDSKEKKQETSEDISKHSLAVTRTLSCAQDLHLIKDKLVGDPVDIEMFKTSDCSLEMKEFKEGTFVGDYVQKIRSLTVVKPNKNLLNALNKSEDFGFLILNIFPFCSNKKRMGAVVMDSSQSSILGYEQSQNQSLEGGNKLTDKYFYVCKGAPEKIKEICRKESIPENFNYKLDEYTKKGIRVIAFAYKSLESPNMRQEDGEIDLEFQGFLLLSNPLQPKTRRTIKNLLFNHVECSMITGDHLFTGINVGYGSGILEKFDNVWVGQFDISEKKVNWRFFTFEELFRNVHKVKETPNTDSDIFEESAPESKRTPPKESEKFTKLRKNKYNDLDEYTKNITTIETNTLNQILSQNTDINFKLALDGNAMQYLFEKYDTDSPEIIFLLKNTKIYARCKPDQKRLIIEKLKHLKSTNNECVAFVGDGANDCKALNKADIGLSIGNSDASMASPFITSEESIEKICDTLELGRYSIENFVQLYLCLNGLGVMDVGALLILLYGGYYFSNWKYLTVYWYYFPMALVICLTSSTGSINKILPQGLMFNRRVVWFLLGTSAVILLALGCGYWIYTGSPTFKGFSEVYSESSIDMEDHFVIDHALLTVFYTFCGTAYSMAVQTGYPFKRPFYTNYWYLFLAIFLIVSNIVFSNPSAFFDSFSLNYFAVGFGRAVDYQGLEYWKWVVFSVISCSAIFLVGGLVMDFFLRQQISKLEEREKEQSGSRQGLTISTVSKGSGVIEDADKTYLTESMSRSKLDSGI